MDLPTLHTRTLRLREVIQLTDPAEGVWSQSCSTPKLRPFFDQHGGSHCRRWERADHCFLVWPGADPADTGHGVGTSSGGSSFWDQSSSHQDPTIIKPCICWVTLNNSFNFFLNYSIFLKTWVSPNPLKTFLREAGSDSSMGLLVSRPLPH